MFEAVTCIYFDLDNTLINRNAAFMACLETFFEEYLPTSYFYNEQAEIEENDDWGYTNRSDFIAWFIQKYQPWGWEDDNLWNYLKANIGAYVPPIAEPLRQHLLALKARYTMGILTNGSIINQSRKIKRAQLDTLFSSDRIHISEQYQLAKPDPRIFQRILEEEGLQPEQLLYVGDDPVNDILAASALGIRTCWVGHHREWSSEILPDLEVERVLDLVL